MSGEREKIEFSVSPESFQKNLQNIEGEMSYAFVTLFGDPRTGQGGALTMLETALPKVTPREVGSSTTVDPDLLHQRGVELISNDFEKAGEKAEIKLGDILYCLSVLRRHLIDERGLYSEHHLKLQAQIGDRVHDFSNPQAVLLKALERYSVSAINVELQSGKPVNQQEIFKRLRVAALLSAFNDKSGRVELSKSQIDYFDGQLDLEGLSLEKAQWSLEHAGEIEDYQRNEKAIEAAYSQYGFVEQGHLFVRLDAKSELVKICAAAETQDNGLIGITNDGEFWRKSQGNTEWLPLVAKRFQPQSEKDEEFSVANVEDHKEDEVELMKTPKFNEKGEQIGEFTAFRVVVEPLSYEAAVDYREKYIDKAGRMQQKLKKTYEYQIEKRKERAKDILQQIERGEGLYAQFKSFFALLRNEQGTEQTEEISVWRLGEGKKDKLKIIARSVNSATTEVDKKLDLNRRGQLLIDERGGVWTYGLRQEKDGSVGFINFVEDEETEGIAVCPCQAQDALPVFTGLFLTDLSKDDSGFHWMLVQEKIGKAQEFLTRFQIKTGETYKNEWYPMIALDIDNLEVATPIEISAISAVAEGKVQGVPMTRQAKLAQKAVYAVGERIPVVQRTIGKTEIELPDYSSENTPELKRQFVSLRAKVLDEIQRRDFSPEREFSEGGHELVGVSAGEKRFFLEKKAWGIVRWPTPKTTVRWHARFPTTSPDITYYVDLDGRVIKENKKADPPKVYEQFNNLGDFFAQKGNELKT